MKEITEEDILKVWKKIVLYGLPSHDHKLIICTALSRFPASVQEKILKDTIFVLMPDHANGIFQPIVIPKDDDGKLYTLQKFVILKSFEDDWRTREMKMRTVAHEISHSVLYGELGEDGKHLKAHEMGADVLIKMFGFDPSYAEYPEERYIPEPESTFHILRVDKQLKHRMMQAGDDKVIRCLHYDL